MSQINCYRMGSETEWTEGYETRGLPDGPVIKQNLSLLIACKSFPYHRAK